MAITKKVLREHVDGLVNKAKGKAQSSFDKKIEEYAKSVFSSYLSKSKEANRHVDKGVEIVREMFDEVRHFFGNYHYPTNNFLTYTNYDLGESLMLQFKSKATQALLFSGGNLSIGFLNNPNLHDELWEIVKEDVEEYKAVNQLSYKIHGIINSVSPASKALKVLEEAGLDMSDFKEEVKAKVSLPALTNLGDSVNLLNKKAVK